MAGNSFLIREAISEEAPAIAAVEQASWPPGMGADQAVALARIEAFPAGQLVAICDHQVVGYAAAQRINVEQLRSVPLTYAELTDYGRLSRSHRPTGSIWQLIGVAVHPEHRGAKLARRLVDEQIRRARQTPGVCRILGFTRPAQFAQFAGHSIDEYLRRRDPTGSVIDRVVAFHLDAGARLVSVHAGFRSEDHAAGGYGVLIEYPIQLG